MMCYAKTIFPYFYFFDDDDFDCTNTLDVRGALNNVRGALNNNFKK